MNGAYDSDCYKAQEYMLTYTDGKTAQFMPGTADFFNMAKCKDNVGKDYKRLVFYPCTVEDNLLSNGLDDHIEMEPLTKVGMMDNDPGSDIIVRDCEFTENIGLQQLQESSSHDIDRFPDQIPIESAALILLHL